MYISVQSNFLRPLSIVFVSFHNSQFELSRSQHSTCSNVWETFVHFYENRIHFLIDGSK